MKILLIDTDGGGNGNCDWALRCKWAGHDVKWWQAPRKFDKGKSEVGDGLIDKVPDWRKHMDWADIIVLGDNTYNLKEFDKYREQGYPIFGATSKAAQWELNRSVGQSILEKHGIKTIPTKEFDSYDEAIKYVLKNPKRYVCKPNGDEPDKSLSYVSKSADDMIYMLMKWKEENSHKGSFVMQDFIPGSEFAVGAWFGPAGFCAPLFESTEFKKLMNGELGPNTGEQGTVGRYVKQSKLFDMVLKPLAGDLHKIDYVGYVDVNCMVAEDGTPYPLEFTMRFGYPTFQLMQAGHVGDPVQWMKDLLDGKDTLDVLWDTVLSCVVIAHAEYPHEYRDAEDNSGIPIYFEGNALDHIYNIHPSQIKLGKVPKIDNGKVKMSDEWVSAGNYLITISATGKSVSDSCKNAYELVKKVKVPNDMMYRTDIGEKMEKTLPKLQKFGFAKGFKY
jgi:phosphoribosylamine--glycine ligase